MQNIEEIYKEYFRTVYKYLFCLTHSEDIAEELTQETFYKAIKGINKFRGDCKMSVWLCQIAKNLWYNQCKKNKKISSNGEDELLNISVTESLDESIIQNDEKVNLYKKIQKLDEVTRNVVYLRITGELSFKDIGVILNKSENWARVTFYRGKIKLKEDEKYEEN